MNLDPWLGRRHRYKTVLRTAPFIYQQGIRRAFRRSPLARAALTGVDHPEVTRKAHDVYCGMFLRGYTQATGLASDPMAGLAVTLFTAFMYVFDDEFEARLGEPGAALDVRSIMTATGVREVWGALDRCCSSAGCWDEVRHQILEQFLLPQFDDYRQKIVTLRQGRGDVETALAVVEFDSGTTLRTAYQVIRAVNRHAPDLACEEQFRLVGVGGKFIDDLSDFRADVTTGSPNLLWSYVQEDDEEREAAALGWRGSEPLTPQWWGTNCPRTFRHYSAIIIDYRRAVTVPGLRLTLDMFLALLGTDRFWRYSTVRAPRR